MIVRVLGVLADQVCFPAPHAILDEGISGFIVMPVAFFVAARWKGPTGVACRGLHLCRLQILPL